jgi:proteasome lid subunit RPN8/RPN11
MTMQLEPRLIREIARLAEAGYPEEVCGAVVGRRAEPGSFEVRPLPNIAGRQAQRGSEEMIRDARTAYYADPVAECRLLRELDEDGREIVALYHSHPDAGAYFSALDREMALLPDGSPLWPGVSYLVLSVRGGRAASAALFDWDPERRCFLERPLPLPPSALHPTA